jgi:hypothetical protein
MSGDDPGTRQLASEAEALLNNELMKSLLNEMIQIATEKSITAPDVTAREAARQEVLAIMALRGNLAVLVESWKGRAAAEQRRKASE